MKKTIFTLMVMVMLVSSLPMKVYAGDINSAEQRIIAAISATYEYDGAYYKVTDAYIEKVKEYLSRDNIDMSDAEVDNYLNQFYANIPMGISAGYMECVGKVESDKKPDKPEQSETQEESQDEGTDERSENSSDNSSDNNSENSSETESSISGTIEETETETVFENVIKINKDGKVEVSGEDKKDANPGGTQEYMVSTEETEEESSLMETKVEEQITEPTSIEEKEAIGKDYSEAEPYQKGISVGTIAIAIVVVVAIVMVCVLLWHKNKRYRR